MNVIVTVDTDCLMTEGLVKVYGEITCIIYVPFHIHYRYR